MTNLMLIITYFFCDNNDVLIFNKRSNRELINRKLNIQSKQKTIYNDNVNIKKIRRRIKFFTFVKQETKKIKTID